MRLLLLSLIIISTSSFADDNSSYNSGLDAGCTAAGISNNQTNKADLEKRSSAYQKGWDVGYKQCEREKLKAKAGIK